MIEILSPDDAIMHQGRFEAEGPPSQVIVFIVPSLECDRARHIVTDLGLHRPHEILECLEILHLPVGGPANTSSTEYSGLWSRNSFSSRSGLTG